MDDKIARFIEDNDIEVTSIKDFGFFEKYVKFMSHKIVTDTRIVASDGRELSLTSLPHHLKKKIEGLPEEEIAEILKKKKLYATYFGKANGYKRQAFGVEVNRKWKMKKHFGKRTMLHEKKDEIIELFGRMMSISEVHEIIVSEYLIPCNYYTVRNFREKYVDVIEQKIEAFKRDYSDMRLGIKRGRLEEYLYLYRNAKRNYRDKDHNRNEGRFMVEILRHIKEEVEGDLDIRISGGLDLKIENSINVHIQAELLKKMNVTQIILTRVAQRMNKDPYYLLNKLMKSYYKDFTAINGDPAQKGEAPPLPAGDHYDFDKIAKVHANGDIEEIEIIEEQKALEVERVEATSDTNFKEMLMKKIKTATVDISVKERKAKIRGIKSAEAREEEKGKRAAGTVSTERIKKSSKRTRLKKDIKTGIFKRGEKKKKQ